ncbi:MAG: CHASE3 domain-containing protein, partial [Burkholderiaceae bacterium]
MTDDLDLDLATARRLRTAPLPPKIGIAFIVAMLSVLLISLASYLTLEQRSEAAERIIQSSRSLDHLKEVLVTMLNAETGKRGYLLTGDDAYLDPYRRARATISTDLAELGKSTPEQRAKFDTLAQYVADSLGIMDRTIGLRRGGDAVGALAYVQSGRGKLAMDRIRDQIASIARDEEALRSERQRQWQEAVNVSTLVAVGGSVVLLGLILLALGATLRGHREQRARSWIESGQVRLSLRMGGEQTMEALGAKVIETLAQYLDAGVGAIHVAEDDGRLR